MSASGPWLVVQRHAYLLVGCLARDFYTDWLALDAATGKVVAGGCGNPIAVCGQTVYVLDEEGIYYVTPLKSGALALPQTAAGPIELDLWNRGNQFHTTTEVSHCVWPVKSSKPSEFVALLVGEKPGAFLMMQCPLNAGDSLGWCGGRQSVLRFGRRSEGQIWVERFDPTARLQGNGAVYLPARAEPAQAQFSKRLQNGAAVFATDTEFFAVYPEASKVVAVPIPRPLLTNGSHMTVDVYPEANALLAVEGAIAYPTMEKAAVNHEFAIRMISLEDGTVKFQHRIPVVISRFPGQLFPN